MADLDLAAALLKCISDEQTGEVKSAWGDDLTTAVQTTTFQENKKFEDDFVNSDKVSKDCNNSPQNSTDYQPLPDTHDYIRVLESKLKKVQGSGSLTANLSLKRADEARRLLDSAARSVNADLPPELIQDLTIQDNPLLRTIFPERQAVAQSELTRLVLKETSDNDQLKDTDNKDNTGKESDGKDVE